MREGVATSSTPLSPRQTEILNQIAKGQPNKRIARTLGISEQTVKNHVTSIMDKLDANDRTHAVVLAMLNGWLNIQDVSEVRSEEELAPSLARS
jgi:DNA-binding NarL/FixJ family response regulator